MKFSDYKEYDIGSSDYFYQTIWRYIYNPEDDSAAVYLVLICRCNP
jgi:hypothetical protein